MHLDDITRDATRVAQVDWNAAKQPKQPMQPVPSPAVNHTPRIQAGKVPKVFGFSEERPWKITTLAATCKCSVPCCALWNLVSNGLKLIS